MKTGAVLARDRVGNWWPGTYQRGIECFRPGGGLDLTREGLRLVPVLVVPTDA